MRRLKTEILVIGGGGAGSTCAAVAAAGGAEVVLASKEPQATGDTRISEGIMASRGSVVGGLDSVARFVTDIVHGGEYLSRRGLARRLAEFSPQAAALVERMGMAFRRGADGSPRGLPTPIGGHTLPRTLMSPAEGVAFGHAMVDGASSERITLLDECLAVELLHIGDSPRIAGALLLDMVEGEPVVVEAGATVLACGGLGALFAPHSDNMRGVTGDGYALAYLAGATLVDMEQVQFIPFAITHPEGKVGLLCGEPALAGLYGRLTDRNGREILQAVALKTRAEVARAIALAAVEGRGGPHGGAFLDLSGNFDTPSGRRFYQALRRSIPAIFDNVQRAYGARAAEAREPWEVYPSAHYQMGGVRVDDEGRSDIPHLFAVGQNAGGLHGANRLGSMSLTELFVFGARAAGAAVCLIRKTSNTTRTSGDPVPDQAAPSARIKTLEAPLGRSAGPRPRDLVRRLQEAVWRGLGPVRTEEGIARTLNEIDALEEEAGSMAVPTDRTYNVAWRDAVELKHMLLTARLVALSALERRETRGAHVRLDHPQRDDSVPPVSITLRRDLAGRHDPAAPVPGPVLGREEMPLAGVRPRRRRREAELLFPLLRRTVRLLPESVKGRAIQWALGGGHRKGE